ncbi:hypothetical protein V6N13_141999 [Hibiscus sabdariffa]|uniref:Uncharacterized protein n=1 Tax=Hibiscus sabdariffa TaxID=183260 RepID=A0ABR2FCR7_9ROSI
MPLSKQLSAVMLHPSYVTVDDFKSKVQIHLISIDYEPNFASVKVPITILGAEFDHMSPPKLIEQFEEIVKAGGVRRPNAWFHFIFYLLPSLNEPGYYQDKVLKAPRC